MSSLDLNKLIPYVISQKEDEIRNINPIWKLYYDTNNLDSLQLVSTVKLNPTKLVLTAAASQVGAVAIDNLTNKLLSKINLLLGDTGEFGQTLGSLFSNSLSSAGDTMVNNLLKGKILTENLGENVGASLASSGAGMAANYIGKGISAIGNNSRLSRGIGSGVSKGLGIVGGLAANNLVKYGSLSAGKGKDITPLLSSKNPKSINPVALAISMGGATLDGAMGPSKEYEGKYGNITQTADLIYDINTAGASAIPYAGLWISAFMSLNKGLSNVFGSTDGMTKTDAILGSAWMPFHVKWANTEGSKRTGTFNNLSWQNSEKIDKFMGNAFGDIGERFLNAREFSNKTYGRYSRDAYNDALYDINFSNLVWDKMLALEHLNEILNIRSRDMNTINNQRYIQSIGGGYSPLARGKLGMKILNNATNHNIGMRLLSGAALIDNKQMILCSAVD